MTLIEILTVVLIVFASALCVALILYLGKITNTFKAMQIDLSQISSDIKPLVSSVSELAEKLTEVTDEAKDQLQVSKSIVLSLRDRVDTILNLEEKVRVGIEEPLTSLIRNLKAISSGVSTFFNYFKK